jgi:hypothetical protein
MDHVCSARFGSSSIQILASLEDLDIKNCCLVRVEGETEAPAGVKARMVGQPCICEGRFGVRFYI